MNDLTTWALVVGFVLPPALSVVQQSHWPDAAKAVVAFLACAIAGAVTALVQGDLTGKRFTQAALVILVTAISTYKGFWLKTGIAPHIERRTDFTRAP